FKNAHSFILSSSPLLLLKANKTETFEGVAAAAFSMSLIAGSYERFIWGFKLKPSSPYSLTPLFSYPSHLSPITSVTAAATIAASGSSDDTIHLYSLSTSSSLGSIPLSSSVTSLSFFTPPSLSFPRNLLSASSDGSVSIFDTDPFVLLKTVTRVHKKGINDLAVHPSGKLALTVGRDECLAMVNLVRGRRSFCCRLGKEAGLVEFGFGGERFFMVCGQKVGVHEAEDARLLCEFENTKRVLCVSPGENGVLFTGGEDRNITAWDTNSGKIAYCIEDAHSARVKGIVVFTANDGGAAVDDPYLVASASSDGVIRVWDVRMALKEKANPLAEANTKSRLTCLAGSSLKSFKRPKIGKTASKHEQDPAIE
ncbi:WD40 domain-containing protein, partial [Cephalotus follicularis]